MTETPDDLKKELGLMTKGEVGQLTAADALEYINQLEAENFTLRNDLQKEQLRHFHASPGGRRREPKQFSEKKTGLVGINPQVKP